MKKTNIQCQQEIPGGGQGSSLLTSIHLMFRGANGFTPSLGFSIILFAFSFLISCSDDDQAPADPLSQELNQLRAVVAPYQDLDNGINAGYDNEFTGYRAHMGYHYLKASLLDDKFELEKPEVLLYAPDANGNLQFVAVEYAIPIDNMDNPPPAPAGFTGDTDVWEINTEFKVWTLHVWVGMDNPHGIFASHNHNLP